ncbi:MAG: prepilin-type N-terminal cleavage/methylation domain-containing protein, partial [Pseudomonas protegens]
MRRSNQGFTLIEIMIVIAIIGLVLTLSLPSITEY